MCMRCKKIIAIILIIAISVLACSSAASASLTASDFFILGDTDSDGTVDVTDATFIQRYCVGIGVPSMCSLLADADCDGDISVIDSTIIQRYAADMYVPYDNVGESLYEPSDLVVSGDKAVYEFESDISGLIDLSSFDINVLGRTVNSVSDLTRSTVQKMLKSAGLSYKTTVNETTFVRFECNEKNLSVSLYFDETGSVVKSCEISFTSGMVANYVTVDDIPVIYKPDGFLSHFCIVEFPNYGIIKQDYNNAPYKVGYKYVYEDWRNDKTLVYSFGSECFNDDVLDFRTDAGSYSLSCSGPTTDISLDFNVVDGHATITLY